MSLLDTLAPPDLSLEDVVPDGSLLQTTAQPDVDDPEMALLSFDDVSEAVGGAHVAGAQSSGPPVAGPVAKPRRDENESKHLPLRILVASCLAARLVDTRRM